MALDRAGEQYVEKLPLLPDKWRERVDSVYRYFLEKKNNPTIKEHQVEGENIRTLCSWMELPIQLRSNERATTAKVSILISGLFDMESNNAGNQGQEIGLCRGVLEGTDHVAILKAEGQSERSYRQDNALPAKAWVERFLEECQQRNIDPHAINIELVGHSEGNKQAIFVAQELINLGIIPKSVDLISGVGFIKEKSDLSHDSFSLEQPVTSLRLAKKILRVGQQIAGGLLTKRPRQENNQSYISRDPAQPDNYFFDLSGLLRKLKENNLDLKDKSFNPQPDPKADKYNIQTKWLQNLFRAHQTGVSIPLSRIAAATTMTEEMLTVLTNLTKNPNLYITLFAADKDPTAPANLVRPTVEQLRQAGGRLTYLEGRNAGHAMGHDHPLWLSQIIRQLPH